ncbi:O-antigen translocase [Bacillus sp. CGMCC 1.16607]|uniref:O-antigen translocase n=1 Tax=Bacillus sp. CGMCC 1.16607 TaxID=3351842 RepID=UPI003633A1F1
MNFIKTSMFSALSTSIKLASGLVINKIVAVFIGPTGIALIGQFQNFLDAMITIGSGAINSGVTKYVAEYHETDDKKRNDVISASLVITVIFSLVLGASIFCGSTFLSHWILKSNEYHILFKLLGVTLFFICFNTILLSIINGMKKIKLFITINISSSLLSLIITTILTIKYALVGALIAMVIVQSIILLITLPIVLKRLDIKFKWNEVADKSHFRKLICFSLMTIISIISVSLTQIMIRNHLINHLSMDEAGYWQSVSKISSMYLMVVTTAFSTYYLPRLSELQTKEELRKEILSGYKFILPFASVSALFIYFLRDTIISLLFTPEFISMRNLFFFQLIGDFFKVASWTLSFLMIAKAMTKMFIFTEILFSLFFYGMTVWFVHLNGMVGVTQAYALNYFSYLLFMFLLFYKLLFLKENTKLTEPSKSFGT